MSVGKFFLGIFLDSDGLPSFSRVATAVILVFSFYWVSRIVVLTGQFPDMTGLTGFMAVLYGSNVVASAMDRGPKS